MPELETQVDPKEEQVRGWIFEQLLADGFTVAQSERLSQAGVDYREAERLLNAGCPTRLAFRILRPFGAGGEGVLTRSARG